MSHRTTLLTNVYNEEYLLPFWLEHHKDMFDDIIIVDYHSTDRSMEICRAICPHSKIITTKNPNFDARKIDVEFMLIERGIEGIKIVLNTTEFLCIEKPIREYFKDAVGPVSFAVNAISPYSKNETHVSTTKELFSSLLNDDVVYHYERGTRQIHTFPSGNYTTGRHSTNNPSVIIDNMYIIWFGYYPFNESLLKRKLQIQNNIPASDIEQGLGYHHLFSREKLFENRDKKAASGRRLIDINPGLYRAIEATYKGYCRV